MFIYVGLLLVQLCVIFDSSIYILMDVLLRKLFFVLVYLFESYKNYTQFKEHYINLIRSDHYYERLNIILTQCTE